MVRLRKQRQPYPSSIAIILASGHVFFHDLPGDVEGNLPLLRRAWNDPEIRAATIERHQSRGMAGEPWAATMFGQ
jgi:hypothetical protein